MAITLSQEAAQIFLDAADYIEKYGWQKTEMSEHGKPRCSMSALTSVQPKVVFDCALSALMFEALYDELGGITLTEFNEQAKNGSEVALLFRKTATKLHDDI